ncbi:MAG: hypothetical protein ACREMY_24760, partial [bacterium]
MFCAVPSTSALRHRASVWLQSLPPHSEALILGPTKAASDEFARTFSRAGLHRLTLIQLAAELATNPLAEQDLAPASRLGLEALTAHVVHCLRRDGRLVYFRPVADTPGFARALAATLHELRLNAVTAEMLARSGEPGTDLACFLTLYERQLRERKLADQAVLLTMAAEVAQSGAHRLAKLPLALLDVPLETHAHRRLAGALVETSPSFFAGVLQGDEVALRALREITAEESEPAARDGAAALDRVRRHLFSRERPPLAEPDATVELFSAPGEGLECVEIARRIQHLAAQGTPFDRIAILLRNP